MYELMKRFDPSRDATTTCMTRQLQTFIEDSRLPMLAVDPYYFGHDRSINIPWPSSTSMELFTTALENWSAAAERCDKHLWLVFQLFGDIGDVIIMLMANAWSSPAVIPLRCRRQQNPLADLGRAARNFKGFALHIHVGPTIYKALSRLARFGRRRAASWNGPGRNCPRLEETAAY